jgi:hypothetical protein
MSNFINGLEIGQLLASKSNMRRCLTYFLFASPLLAQTVRPEPQQAPVDALIQSYQSALSNGKFTEAAAKRDEARGLLNQIPANDPLFANWAQRISGIYENDGFGSHARDVLEQALARTAALGDQSPARTALLGALANSWQQDRNLLKALSYTEQAVAAAEMQPPQKAPAQTAATAWFSPSMGAIFGAFSSSRVAVFRGGPGAENAELYQRLFNLYRELGRPQDAAAVLTRINAHVKNSDGLLASLYQQQGQTDEASAIYKRQAAEASDPQQAAGALQQLANLDQGAQRYADAASAMQEAIGKLESSGDPNAVQGAVWMRQSLANMLRQAGQPQAADEVYRQLMADGASRQVSVVTGYADFLAQTNRAGQAEKLLQDYQNSQVNSEPWEQNSLMMALANVERLSGKPDLAEEYQRRALAEQPRPTVAVAVESSQRASEAANAGKLDEAFNLTLQALDSSRDDYSLQTAGSVASVLAARQAPAKADEIYRRILTLAENRSAATAAPLSFAMQNYARTLRDQARWGEFEQILERYRATLTAARGSGTGWLEDAVRLRTDAVYRPERRHDALAASQELVKLEESLSGSTSEPYLRATQTLASAMEVNGDRAAALPLHRKTVTIADLVYPANDARRATTRLSAAMALANQQQFEEAEQLAREAIAIGQHVQPPQAAAFAPALQQILQMKQAAQASSAPKQ